MESEAHETPEGGGPPKPLPDDVLSQVIGSDVPTYYANGFLSFMSHSDVGIVFQRHAQAVALLSLSYTTAKTLVTKLGALIQQLEERTGQSIMTTDEVDQANSRRESK